MVELFLNDTCSRCPSKLLQVICVVKYFCHQIQDLCCYRKSSLPVHVQFGILLQKYFFTKIPVARCLQPGRQVCGTIVTSDEQIADIFHVVQEYVRVACGLTI